MKRVFVALFLFLCAGSVLAQSDIQQIERPPLAPRTAGELFQRIAAQRSHATKLQPSPNVIAIDFPSDRFIIPISGNTPGSFGTYFRTDVTVANLRQVSQPFAFVYLQAGTDNTAETPYYYQLGAGQVFTFIDLVGAYLKRSGLGALFVYGTDSAGNIDGNAKIDGFARIWTPQPGSSGSVSQNFDALDNADLVGNGITYIMGLRQSSQFRSNVGIVNLATAPHTFIVTSLVTGASTQITVPPLSVVQQGIAAGSADANGNVALGISTDTSDFWSAYGTTNDNTTGDGWVSRAKRYQP